MKFLGFLVFVVIASAAFFTIASLSLTLPMAFKPKKEEEADDNTEEASH